MLNNLHICHIFIEGEKGSPGDKGSRGDKGEQGPKGMPGTCNAQVVTRLLQKTAVKCSLQLHFKAVHLSVVKPKQN